MDPMFRPVQVLETRKEDTQRIERIVTALARTHMNLRNDPHRALHGEFFIDVRRPPLTKRLVPLLRGSNNHKMIIILKNPKRMIPKPAQYLFLN